MKATSLFYTLLSAPIIFCATAMAQEVKTNIKDYLPCDGTVRQGAVVRIARDTSFVELHKKAVERFIKLPRDKQEEINKAGSPTTLMAYRAELWPDKAEYDQYVAAWKKSQIIPVTEVAVGLKLIKDEIYSVLSATRVSQEATMPITLGSLQYNANKNVWTSNNGDLVPKTYTAGEDYDFGAQTGTEWNLERKDSLSTLNEMVRVTKTTDGKYVYVVYSLSEVSAISGTPLANHGYVLRFPLRAAAPQITRPGQK